MSLVDEPGVAGQFLTGFGLMSAGLWSWFRLGAVVPGVLLFGIGAVILLVLMAVALGRPNLVGAIVIVPAIAAVATLGAWTVATLWPVLVAIGVGLLLLWNHRSNARIGRAPDGFAQSFGALFESLSGRSTGFDEVLIELGLLGRNAEGFVQRPAVLGAEVGPYEDCVRFRPLPGTARAWATAMQEIPHLYGADLVLSSPEAGVLVMTHHHTTPPPEVDPLADPIVVSAVPTPDVWALRVGIDESGEWVDVSLANRAGLVVGGQPGSGKSGSLRAMMLTLGRFADVQMAIVDGKGGSDWAVLAPRAFAYLSTVDDLESVVDLLRSLEAERARRVAAMMDLRSTANFWDRGPTSDLPLIVLVVDEVQAIVSRQYHPSKTARDLVDEATGLLLRLVAQGRSAGMLCILATQKPTSDNLPTSLRDSAGIKLAYSVPTRQAAEAVLGDVWSAAESGITPVGAAQGVAVLSDGMGALVRLRSPFIPDVQVWEVARETRALAADPRSVGEQS